MSTTPRRPGLGRRHGLPAAVSTVAGVAVGWLTNLVSSGWTWPLGVGLVVLAGGWAWWEWRLAVRGAAHSAPSSGRPLADVAANRVATGRVRVATGMPAPATEFQARV